MSKDLLTTQEVAELFRVDESTVSRWRTTGILTGYRIGGVLRFRREDVLAVISPDNRDAS